MSISFRSILLGSVCGAAPDLTSIVSAITLGGVALRGYKLTSVNNASLPVVIQSRTSSTGTWTDTALVDGFTVGNGNSGTGLVGRGYRASVTYKGVRYFSPEVGPTGITDSVPTSAYYSTGTNVVNINTDGAGKNTKYNMVRGTDYDQRITFYNDDLGANAKMSWMQKAVTNTGEVFCYMFFARNRYTDDSAASPFIDGVQHSSLSSASTSKWNLVEQANSAANKSVLIEYFSSPQASSQANRVREFGVLPIVSASARTYFTGSSALLKTTYVDENGLTWGVSLMPGDGTVRYLVAYEPSGTPRLSGSFRWDRYINFCIANGLASGANYMNGMAAGIEVNMESGGGSGALTGQFMNSDFALTPAAAYTFDTDVAAYFSRFSNTPGIEVRKAVDAFVTGLKADGTYALLDGLVIPRAGGVSDMRKNLKNSAYDIVDRSGAATYVPGQGLTYAAGGYGGTNFTPATASGNWATSGQEAFLGAFIEADTGLSSAMWLGNSKAALGRGTAASVGAGGLKHQLNNSSVTFGGGNAGTYVPSMFSIRRHSGATPEGTTIASVVEYDVKRSGSTNNLYNTGTPNTSVPAVAPASGDGDIKIGSNDGSALSTAVFSVIAWGGGLTKTQVDTFNSRVVTLRTALAAAGV